MKTQHKVRRNLTKSAHSPQQQTHLGGRHFHQEAVGLIGPLKKCRAASLPFVVSCGLAHLKYLFMCEIQNNAWLSNGYVQGDVLRVDPEIKPRSGNLVVAKFRGHDRLLFKQCHLRRGQVQLKDLQSSNCSEATARKLLRKWGDKRHKDLTCLMDYHWYKASDFDFIYPVVAMTRDEWR